VCGFERRLNLCTLHYHRYPDKDKDEHWKRAGLAPSRD
jgi:hypothetical protein